MAGTGKEKKRGQAQAQEEEGSDDDDEAEQISQVLREFATTGGLVERLYNFMNFFVFQNDKNSLGLVGQFPDLVGLVKTTLIQSENHHLRGESGRRLREMLINCSGVPELRQTLKTVLRVLLIEVLPAVRGKEGRSVQYFDQVRRTVEELQVADMAPLELELWELTQKLASDVVLRDLEILQGAERTEAAAKHEDRCFVGMVTLLGVLLQKYPQRKAEIGCKLVPHLLQQCLFQVPQGAGSVQVASKAARRSQACRAAGLRLLPVLTRDCLSNLQLVLDYIGDFSRRASWRTNKLSDWAITHLDDEKSSTGYVGLKNLGCICYMISLFQ